MFVCRLAINGVLYHYEEFMVSTFIAANAPWNSILKSMAVSNPTVLYPVHYYAKNTEKHQ